MFVSGCGVLKSLKKTNMQKLAILLGESKTRQTSTLSRLTFHSFRRWKATIECPKTEDIVHLKNNPLKTPTEIKKLLEAASSYLKTD
jgi:hypothetical protein